MTSQLLSRIFDNNSPSIYDAFREHDAMSASESELDDLEERAGMLPQQTTAGDSSHYDRHPQSQPRPFFTSISSPAQKKFPRYHDDDDDADVPESLLFETAPQPTQPSTVRGGSSRRGSGPPEPSTEPNIAQRLADQWEAAMAPPRSPLNSGFASTGTGARVNAISPKDRALWKWANVQNLDSFLGDVYAYFVGKGIYSILLERALNLLTLGFVVSFTAFLGMCIDYTKLKTGNHMNHINDIMVEHCMSG